jgi:hypothetical protein
VVKALMGEVKAESGLIVIGLGDGPTCASMGIRLAAPEWLY